MYIYIHINIYIYVYMDICLHTFVYDPNPLIKSWLRVREL